MGIERIASQAARTDTGVLLRSVDRETMRAEYRGHTLTLPVGRGLRSYGVYLSPTPRWDDGALIPADELATVKAGIAEILHHWKSATELLTLPPTGNPDHAPHPGQTTVVHMGPRDPDTEAGLESVEGDPGHQRPAPTGPTASPSIGRRGRFKSRRARLFLALSGGILALLALGVVGATALLYDEATAIKRTDPDVVVDSFLAAFLVNRDDNEARLYQCDSGGDLTEITRFRDEMVQTEKDYSVKVTVTWSSLDVATSGQTGTVDVDLTQTSSGTVGRDSRAWQIKIVDQDGWRVCGATEV